MTADQIVQILGYIGIGGIASAVVVGMFNRRKLSADATKIITGAAAGVVEILKSENGRLVARVEATEREQVRQRDENRALIELVAVHGLWDQQAFTMLREQGIDLPPPPPLHMTPRSTP